jgi:WD40 repeat protein
MSRDYTEVLTCSEDHQMIMWDAESTQPKYMFCGHTDLVTGGVWIGPKTLVSSSWDCRILTWNVPE